MNHYSVPVHLIGRKVRVLLHPSELVVFDGRLEVARHERLVARGECRLELDHYLETLIRKPGALPGATALEQARQAEDSQIASDVETNNRISASSTEHPGVS